MIDKTEAQTVWAQRKKNGPRPRSAESGILALLTNKFECLAANAEQRLRNRQQPETELFLNDSQPALVAVKGSENTGVMPLLRIAPGDARGYDWRHRLAVRTLWRE